MALDVEMNLGPNITRVNSMKNISKKYKKDIAKVTMKIKSWLRSRFKKT